jgi:hypothetical protein
MVNRLTSQPRMTDGLVRALRRQHLVSSKLDSVKINANNSGERFQPGKLRTTKPVLLLDMRVTVTKSLFSKDRFWIIEQKKYRLQRICHRYLQVGQMASPWSSAVFQNLFKDINSYVALYLHVASYQPQLCCSFASGRYLASHQIVFFVKSSPHPAVAWQCNVKLDTRH